MFKIIKFAMVVFLMSCSSNNIKSKDDISFSQYLPECSAGCSHLASLKEVDGELGCTQSRSNGDECKIICAKKKASGVKNIDPKCWQTLTSCNDFEEQCNFGELYP